MVCSFLSFSTVLMTETQNHEAIPGVISLPFSSHAILNKPSQFYFPVHHCSPIPDIICILATPLLLAFSPYPTQIHFLHGIFKNTSQISCLEVFSVWYPSVKPTWTDSVTLSFYTPSSGQLSPPCCATFPSAQPPSSWPFPSCSFFLESSHYGWSSLSFTESPTFQLFPWNTIYLKLPILVVCFLWIKCKSFLLQ